MTLLRENLDKIPDSDKKAIALRLLDAIITRIDADASSPKVDVSELQDDIKLIEHRAETLKMMKQVIEKT